MLDTKPFRFFGVYIQGFNLLMKNKNDYRKIWNKSVKEFSIVWSFVFVSVIFMQFNMHNH